MRVSERSHQAPSLVPELELRYPIFQGNERVNLRAPNCVVSGHLWHVSILMGFSPNCNNSPSIATGNNSIRQNTWQWRCLSRPLNYWKYFSG